jgi:hypothetical protein
MVPMTPYDDSPMLIITVTVAVTTTVKVGTEVGGMLGCHQGKTNGGRRARSH